MKTKIVRVGFEYDESVDGKYSGRVDGSIKVAVRFLKDAQNKAMKKMFGNGQKTLEWDDDEGKIQKHKVGYSRIELKHFEVLEEED